MAVTSEQRSEIEELLPFWVNGTLSDSEAELVAQAIAADADIKHEVETLERLQAAIQSRKIERSPGAIGLARLRRDIATQRRGLVPPWRPGLQHGLLAASVVLALFGGISLFVSQTREPVFIQASGADPEAALTVAFRGEATAEQISQLLLEMDLIIVDGPSAVRLYRLGVREGEDPGAIVSELRTQIDLIEYVDENR